MTKINYQCDCGLCTSTVKDMYSHWKASGHSAYREVTVANLVKNIQFHLEGLRTFNHALHNSEGVKS